MMEQFWMWFIRPLAEFLGVMALFVGIFSFYVIIMMGFMMWDHFKKKSKEFKERFERNL